MSLPESMIDESTMTARQLESLISYIKVAAGQLKFREAASQRSTGPVTAGSYYRTVSQARNKVRASMVTVLIGLWLGVVRLEDVERLFELAGKGSMDLDDEERSRFVSVIKALLDKLVM